MTTASDNDDGRVHFTCPSGHDGPHRKLESPPPPMEHGSVCASPTLSHRKSAAEAFEIAVAVPDQHSLASPKNSLASSSTIGRTFSSKDLRGNLTRQQVNRDPLHYYEITSVLGVGSMGSVARVCKRESAIGGSARKSVQDRVKREHQIQACFDVPLIGGLFRFCFKIPADAMINVSRHGSFSDLMSAANGTATSSGMKMTYAMKSIHLSRVTDDTFVLELKNEIEILKSLDHPHIVRAIETYEHRNQIFVIMELCSGGDLYSRDPYTEEEAARITSSVLGAISYMHSKGILHRDLKYENILFVNTHARSEVKLIDFGLSKKFGNEELTDGVGTIYTMAPEVLKGKYTQQADLWSVGVVTFMLLSSQMPFYGRKRSHIVEQIMCGQFEFKGRRWKRVSKQGKAFVEDLLVVDPDDRATCEEVLRASWLNRRFSATVRNPDADELNKAQESLVKFADYSKLRKVALMVVAHKSTSTEIGILRKIFQQYDKTGIGQLSYDEFKAALTAAGFTSDDHRKIFDAIDMDGTGKIRYTEFLAATIEAQGAISEERLAEAFDRLDSDDSGFISAENLAEILGSEFPKEEIDLIIKEAGVDHQGKISYAEFLALWEDQHEAERVEAIKEISVMKGRFDSDSLSVLSFDELSDVDGKGGTLLSRAAFIDGKHLSERKATQEEKKHVDFQESIETIPNFNGMQTAADTSAIV